MNDEELDRIARTALAEPPLSAAERQAAWEDISLRLAPPAARSRRRRWIAVPAVAAAAAAAFALVPSGDTTGGTPGLASASAAEVLRATADGVVLGAPGPGEQLYVRERKVFPPGGDAVETEVTRSWSAADGSGRVERAIGGRTSTETFSAGEAARGDVFESWRAEFTPAELRDLPTEQDPLLARLRAVAGASDEDLDIIGRDLAVLAIMVELLDRAPLDAERRAALFDLLAGAPEWNVPGSSATPISVERVGDASAAGFRLRVESRLTDDERSQISSDKRNWAVEITVDPELGRLTEIREYEDGLKAPAQVTTIEEQRIVPAN